MSFELTVGNDSSAPSARVTYSLYNLVSTVLRREFDFPQLIRMFTLGDARFDANELLDEAEVLKDIARAHHRPFVDVGAPLDQIDLEGMLNFPELLRHDVQVVTDWTEIVSFGEGESGIVSSPPTLLSGHGMLHLVDDVAVQVAAHEDWVHIRHITASEFRWEMGQLLADGVPQIDAPSEFLRPWRKHEVLRFGSVTLYDAWREELEALIDACTEGIKFNKPIITRT